MTNVKLSMVVLVVELYLTSLCFCLSVCLSVSHFSDLDHSSRSQQCEETVSTENFIHYY